MTSNKDFVHNNEESAKNPTRDNHYVPQWYQRGFVDTCGQLHYLDLSPDTRQLPDGRIIKFNDRKRLPPSQCFFEYDLYTTFFGPFINDIIEKKIFGKIDDTGAKAVRAFIDGDELARHNHFENFFNYIDAQISRTPKGLTWLKQRYAGLDQLHLMEEMQAVQQMNCTIWYESVREIVSAKESNMKFIISDHPVTVYNFACPPESESCKYPDDSPISWKASQTIFPLDMNHCLILTNLEYANEPNLSDAMRNRTNARNFGGTFARTNAWIRERSLTDHQVQEINFAIKSRARKYIAAAQIDWLYPEKDESITWTSIKQTLLPPPNKLYEFGGEMFFGFADGRKHFQDAFGRTTPNHDFLKKKLPKTEPGPNDACPCGRGRKYKRCCRDLQAHLRPAWDIMSIRQRNMMFYAGLNDILGFNRGKDWEDIRKELNDEQVKSIHQLFGDLWPLDTDILRLLPKPDKRLRAVYTGVIDILTIFRFATGSTLYFEEVFIQNPFTNPIGLKAEYSPIEQPSKFRQQTLINVAFFLELYPFILNGSIDLIPDLGLFNQHLHFQIHNIARHRGKGIEIDDEERKLFDELWDDDHKRMMWSLPEHQQRRMFRESFPNASEELLTDMYHYTQKLRNDDPFSLLQDDLYESGGQITMKSMAPGFEMTAFLAQATGAIIFTDSPTRWQEMVQAQSKEQMLIESAWKKLIDYIKQQRFPFNVNPGMLNDGKLGLMRYAWRDIYNAVTAQDSANVDMVSDQLTILLAKACKEASRELPVNKDIGEESEIGDYTFDAEFDCIIPRGGLINNKVQRLLVTCGVQYYMRGVPIVIFARAIIRK